MPQASVLSDSDIRRVFRVIETTRYAERNRVAFMLSIYAGMRVGEIAALKMGDVVNQYGVVRSEIKLGAHQTKGSKGRTVILSGRIRREIGAYLANRKTWCVDSPLIFSQRNFDVRLDLVHLTERAVDVHRIELLLRNAVGK